MLSLDKQELLKIRKRLEEIINSAHELETHFQHLLDKVHPKNRKSAQNLLHYIALRHQPTEEVQQQLARIGISSLQHAESHVLANVQMVLRIIDQLTTLKEARQEQDPVSVVEGKSILAKNRRALLGKHPRHRSVHIMVTLPSEAAQDYELVKGLIQAGMNCARINCAKDDDKTWLKMIQHVRRAEKELNISCKILMDLGGPKIRTGQIKQGPKVIKIKPLHGLKGETVKPAILQFSTKFKQSSKDEVRIPVDKHWLSKIKKGDVVWFKDVREHKRTVKIKKVNKKGATADLYKAAFLDKRTQLILQRANKRIATAQVGSIPATKQYIFLQKGDTLYLHKDDQLGEPPQYDDAGNIVRPGHIGCSLPEVFCDVTPGDSIFFDDGKIKGKVIKASPDQLQIEITFAKNERRALKPDKGINFPASYLSVSGLTKKDLRDLDFITRHADIVNLSFVRDPKDVHKFLAELDKREAKDLGVMLKIETQRAVKNLPWLILHAMRRYPLSIMIARGDLAIETGWEEMAVLQEEILWLCEAAHIPVVWATQVLEGMAKQGMPKRAEITDAAIAHQADCVMLNKGDYIMEAIKMLDEILRKMEKQKMKSSRLVQQLNFEDEF